MVILEDFMENGKISRQKIVFAIKYGDLCRDDIDYLVGCDEVRKEFFNIGYTKKIDERKWDKDYLDTLVFASVADVFDSEYLYYLCDVTEYVNGYSKKGHKQRSSSIFSLRGIIFIALTVTVCALAFIKIVSKN